MTKRKRPAVQRVIATGIYERNQLDLSAYRDEDGTLTVEARANG